MKAERKTTTVERLEYVLTLTPIEADNLMFLLKTRKDQHDWSIYKPMLDDLIAADRYPPGRFY